MPNEDKNPITGQTNVSVFQSKAGELATDRANLLTTVVDTAQKQQRESEDFMQYLHAAEIKSNKAFDEGSAHLARLAEIQANPAIFNSLMSLFDPVNYDEKAIGARIARSDRELAKTQERVRTATTMHGIRTQAIARERETAATQHALGVEGLSHLETLIKMGWAEEEQHTKAQIRAIEGASAEQLKGWQKDINSAPAFLRKSPGLIKTGLIAKRSADLGLTQSEMSLQHGQLLLSRERRVENRKKAFETTDDATLQKIARGEIEHKDIAPESAKDEAARRIERDETLAGIQDARIAKNTEREAALKKRYLTSLNTEVLGALRTKASESQDGTVSIGEGKGAVTFTRRELEAGHFEAKQKDRERAKTEYEQFVSGAEYKVNEDEIDLSHRLLAGETNPGMPIDVNNPISSLPVDMQVHAARNKMRVESGIKIFEKSGDIVDAENVINEQRTYLEQLKKQREHLIKESPKPEQAARREFTERGRVDSVDAASDLLQSQLKNPGLLGSDHYLDPAFRQLSVKLEAIESSRTKGITLADIQSGTLEIGGLGKRPPAREDIAKAVQQYDGNDPQTSPINLAANSMFHKALGLAIAQMQGASVDPNKNIMAGFVNPETGIFDNKFYKTLATGSKVFNMKAFHTALIAREQIAKSTGKIPPDGSLTDWLVAHMQSPQFRNEFFAATRPTNSTEASMFHILFGNRPQEALSSRIAHMEASAPLAVEDAAKLTQELQAISKPVMETRIPGTTGQMRRTIQGQTGAAEPTVNLTEEKKRMQQIQSLPSWQRELLKDLAPTGGSE